MLRRLAGVRGKTPFGTAADAEAMLGGFGAGPLDAVQFAHWRDEFAPTPVPRRRFGGRGGQVAGTAARGPGGGRLDGARHR
jgi:hypothetical protein